MQLWWVVWPTWSPSYEVPRFFISIWTIKHCSFTTTIPLLLAYAIIPMLLCLYLCYYAMILYLCYNYYYYIGISSMLYLPSNYLDHRGHNRHILLPYPYYSYYYYVWMSSIPTYLWITWATEATTHLYYYYTFTILLLLLLHMNIIYAYLPLDYMGHRGHNPLILLLYL